MASNSPNNISDDELEVLIEFFGILSEWQGAEEPQAEELD